MVVLNGPLVLHSLVHAFGEDAPCLMLFLNLKFYPLIVESLCCKKHESYLLSWFSLIEFYDMIFGDLMCYFSFLQVVHPADLCFKLPENVSLEEGAMCEPLSVGVHACRRANIGPETNVLVMGAGPIGLVTLMAARAFGAPRIVIVDVDDYRLSVAKDLGADEVVKVSIDTQVSLSL